MQSEYSKSLQILFPIYAVFHELSIEFGAPAVRQALVKFEKIFNIHQCTSNWTLREQKTVLEVIVELFQINFLIHNQFNIIFLKENFSQNFPRS